MKPKPEYPTPRWDRLYARFCPEFTDPYSRHARMIAGDHFRNVKADIYRAAQRYDEPEHMAESIEVTVISLWALRKAVADAGFVIKHTRNGRVRIVPAMEGKDE